MTSPLARTRAERGPSAVVLPAPAGADRAVRRRGGWLGWRWLVALGAAGLGGAAAHLPPEALGPLAFGLLLLVALWLLVDRCAPAEHRRPLLLIVLGGYALRVAAGLAIQGFGLLEDVDALRYEDYGLAIARHWRFGEPLDTLHPAAIAFVEQLPGYFYVNAAVFSAFGPNPLGLREFNAALGAFTALLWYRVARNAFGSGRAALLAAALTGFTPTFVVWSAQNLKDPSVTLLVALAFLALQALQRAPSLRNLAMLGACLALIYTLRPQMTLLLAAVSAPVYLLSSRWTWRKGLLFLLGVGVALVGLFGLGRGAYLVQTALDLERIAIQRQLLASGGSAYAGDVPLHSLADLLLFYPTALAYLLFAPFPWTARSLLQWLAVPDTLLWYALIPFALVGGWAARRRIGGAPLAWGLPLFAALFMLAVAPVNANVGTLHRQRVVFLGVCFVLAAAGLDAALTRWPRGFPLAPTLARFADREGRPDVRATSTAEAAVREALAAGATEPVSPAPGGRAAAATPKAAHPANRAGRSGRRGRGGRRRGGR